MEGEKEIRERVDRALSCLGKDIPRELFDAIAEHALSVMARQRAEDAVRDAEEHTRAARASGQPALIEGAATGLEVARRELRGEMFLERMRDGAVEAIRARIALIDAVHRRLDVAAQLEKRNW